MDDQKRQLVPVNIELDGNLLRMYTRHMKKYAGILIEPSLMKLLRDSKIKLETSLILPPAAQSKRPKNAPLTKDTSPAITEPELRIIVYGMLDDAAGVGKTLSDAGLYFQHPSPTDCSLQLRYHNPQFLVRPGGEMPTLEDLSITASASNETQEKQLDELAKARVLRIFDNAHDGALGDQPAVEPSPRLYTALKEYVSRIKPNYWRLIWVCRHQRSALSFMSEKESRIPDIPSSRSLWRTSTDPEGKPT